MVIINLYKLDAAALGNRLEEINVDIESIIQRFLNGDYNDALCFEYIARYYRIVSRILEAEEVIKKGFSRVHNNPVAEASLWHERSRLALVTENFEAEKLYRDKGNTIYRDIGAEKRIVEYRIPEYGEVFAKNYNEMK